jgi:uncharacterized membrane protein YebE (DUF533 family)
MENKNFVIQLVILVVIIAAIGIAAYKSYEYSKEEKTDKYKSTGWLGSLFDNAAEMLDAGGRHSTSLTTSFGNAIVSIIATAKSDGTPYFSEYGYSDKKVNYGPYVVTGLGIFAVAVIAIILINKK